MVRKAHFEFQTSLPVLQLLGSYYHKKLKTMSLFATHFRHYFRLVFPVPPVEDLTHRTGVLPSYIWE